ncbi:MAG: hypothetical protein SVV03_05520, partial [Candidatus Nanohaloarchaea archaeon]|nr:hypothetical protein [Candidatus Nanohaloarchaea archaeon]
LDEVSVGSGNGTVKETSALLNSSLDIGDNVLFEDEPMAFDNVSTVIVEDTEDPNGCLACRWKNGSGDVYYLADTFTETGENAGFIDGDHALGSVMPLEFGRPPNGAETVAVHSRRILVNVSNNGIKRGKLKLVFWND